MKKIILLLAFLATQVFAFDSINWNNEFITLVNEHRIGLGLKPLLYSAQLVEIGEEHSFNMANKHTRFGHGGHRYRCRLAKEAFPNSNLCGENVAFGQEDPKEVFEAWMNSPDHREAIEEPRFTHTGLGIDVRYDGRIYWTQMFLEIFPEATESVE